MPEPSISTRISRIQQYVDRTADLLTEAAILHVNDRSDVALNYLSVAQDTLRIALSKLNRLIADCPPDSGGEMR